MALEGPFQGCDCGCFNRLARPESKASICERCGFPMTKGIVYRSEYPFCVHCGEPFSEHMALIGFVMKELNGQIKGITCGKCKKTTLVQADINFQLRADPPYPDV